ncbi:MAG: Ldh family oxidoreductase [Pseudomonadota bacterium]
MATSTRLTLGEAEALVVAALSGAGASMDQAEPTAAALLLAEADGQSGHGLSRVPSYAVQLASRKVVGEAVPRLEVIRDGLVRVDADHGFAYPAFELALPEVEARARRLGIAAAAVHRSHHFGVAGHPCERLAERGLVAFVWGNAPKAMAPWGAKTAILGTNPIAFAAPMADAPLVIDMALTTVARGKILAARETGDAIPEGWALGPDGSPTTDPAVALQGTMAPAGGAKGAALALMVEVMSACLAGAALGAVAPSLFDAEGGPPDLGQVILAIDPEPASGGAFSERMAALVELFGAAEGARLPGTRRLEARQRARAEGLQVKPKLLAEIERLAGQGA